MAKITQEEQAERMAFCAEQMIRQRSSYRVEQSMHARFGMDARTARRYMQRVRLARRSEASAIDKDLRRDEARAAFETIFVLAINRTQLVKNEDGSVVLDQRPKLPNGQANPNYQMPLTRQNADLQRATHAQREIVHLDGLNEPTKAELKIDGDVGLMPDLKNFGPAAATALGDFLKEIAPGGDISKLAGDIFKFSGEGDNSKAPMTPPVQTPPAEETSEEP